MSFLVQAIGNIFYSSAAATPQVQKGKLSFASAETAALSAVASATISATATKSSSKQSFCLKVRMDRELEAKKRREFAAMEMRKIFDSFSPVVEIPKSLYKVAEAVAEMPLNRDRDIEKIKKSLDELNELMSNYETAEEMVLANGERKLLFAEKVEMLVFLPFHIFMSHAAVDDIWNYKALAIVAEAGNEMAKQKLSDWRCMYMMAFKLHDSSFGSQKLEFGVKTGGNLPLFSSILDPILYANFVPSFSVRVEKCEGKVEIIIEGSERFVVPCPAEIKFIVINKYFSEKRELFVLVGTANGFGEVILKPSEPIIWEKVYRHKMSYAEGEFEKEEAEHRIREMEYLRNGFKSYKLLHASDYCDLSSARVTILSCKNKAVSPFKSPISIRNRGYPVRLGNAVFASSVVFQYKDLPIVVFAGPEVEEGSNYIKANQIKIMEMNFTLEALDWQDAAMEYMMLSHREDLVFSTRGLNLQTALFSDDQDNRFLISAHPNLEEYLFDLYSLESGFWHLVEEGVSRVLEHKKSYILKNGMIFKYQKKEGAKTQLTSTAKSWIWRGYSKHPPLGDWDCSSENPVFCQLSDYTIQLGRVGESAFTELKPVEILPLSESASMDKYGFSFPREFCYNRINFRQPGPTYDIKTKKLNEALRGRLLPQLVAIVDGYDNPNVEWRERKRMRDEG